MLSTNAAPSVNGHSAYGSETTAGGPPAVVLSVPVPNDLCPRLKQLDAAYNKARSDLEAFYRSLMIVMGLPPDTEWKLDTETMILPRLSPPTDANALPPA